MWICLMLQKACLGCLAYCCAIGLCWSHRCSEWPDAGRDARVAQLSICGGACHVWSGLYWLGWILLNWLIDKAGSRRWDHSDLGWSCEHQLSQHAKFKAPPFNCKVDNNYTCWSLYIWSDCKSYCLNTVPKHVVLHLVSFVPMFPLPVWILRASV